MGWAPPVETTSDGLTAPGASVEKSMRPASETLTSKVGVVSRVTPSPWAPVWLPGWRVTTGALATGSMTRVIGRVGADSAPPGETWRAATVYTPSGMTKLLPTTTVLNELATAVPSAAPLAYTVTMAPGSVLVTTN